MKWKYKFEDKYYNKGKDKQNRKYINIKMHVEFLTKNDCIRIAKYIIENKLITDMTILAIAQEIFAHAICYYWHDSESINIFRNNPITEELYRHGADGIYIQDGGDSIIRKIFYKSVWITSFLKK